MTYQFTGPCPTLDLCHGNSKYMDYFYEKIHPEDKIKALELSKIYPASVVASKMEGTSIRNVRQIHNFIALHRAKALLDVGTGWSAKDPPPDQVRAIEIWAAPDRGNLPKEDFFFDSTQSLESETTVVVLHRKFIKMISEMALSCDDLVPTVAMDAVSYAVCFGFL